MPVRLVCPASPIGKPEHLVTTIRLGVVLQDRERVVKFKIGKEW